MTTKHDDGNRKQIKSYTSAQNLDNQPSIYLAIFIPRQDDEQANRCMNSIWVAQCAVLFVNELRNRTFVLDMQG